MTIEIGPLLIDAIKYCAIAYVLGQFLRNLGRH